MIFCRCITCGARAEITKDSTIPDGWVAFSASHWPAGTDIGPLFLRMCRRCKDRLDKHRIIDQEEKFVTRLPPLSKPLDGFKRAYKRCRECGAVMFYDYVPFSLSQPILTTSCGHGATLRDYGLDSISRVEFYATRRRQASTNQERQE